MLLKITHQTDLTYSDLISESVMELRMAPRQEEDQHRLSFNLAIGPPTSASSYFDWLGNTVHAFTINTFHREIRIVATSVLETNREEPDLTTSGVVDGDTWPMRPGPANYRLYDYLQFSGPIIDTPQLRALVDELSPREGMPLGELAMSMISLLERNFEYKQGITSAASPITDILEKRAGGSPQAAGSASTPPIAAWLGRIS
jgi:transglutaminase-like putative cysteine protease